MAVLPTPGSPISTGLFFVRRAKNLHHAANFFIAPNHRIELSASSQVCQIARVFFQRGVGGFWILRRHALRPAHARQRLQNRFMRSALALQQLSRRIALLSGKRQKKMLRRNVLVFKSVCLIKRPLQNIV